MSAAEYGSIIIAYRNGAAVRLSDVATLWKSGEHQARGWMNATPALLINVQRQPPRTWSTSSTVSRSSCPPCRPRSRRRRPAGADRPDDHHPRLDPRRALRAHSRVVLVVLVIFLFLRNVRPPHSCPFSAPVPDRHLCGDVPGALQPEQSFPDGTHIATGFVVDDAIVMIENISRFLEQGDEPLEAALKGSKQIGFTIISLTVSLVAVLIPCFSCRGRGPAIPGICRHTGGDDPDSALVSLTLVPMLCAKLLRRARPRSTPRSPRLTHRGSPPWCVGTDGNWAGCSTISA